MKPLVSVILPIYNVERYFAQCMDSVLNQTFSDIEIILVDDGSPDNCPAMCDQYAQQDNRVQVHHQQNAGVSVARNVGMQMAQGDWIMFVDPDDWLELDAIEVLYQKTKESICDVVIGSHYRAYVDCAIYAAEKHTDATHWYLAPKYTKYLLATCFTAASRNPQLFPGEMQECHTIAAPWGKLYHRNFLEQNHLCFPDNMAFHEDMMFNLQVLYAAKHVCFINHPVYHYRMREDSVVGAVQNNRHKQIVYAFERMGTFIQECGMEEDILPYLQICIVLDILRMIQRCCECVDSQEDIVVYTKRLETMMQNEGIRDAVCQVKKEQVGNHTYRPMLTMLKEGQYEAMLLKYRELYQKPVEQQTKIKFM